MSIKFDSSIVNILQQRAIAAPEAIAYIFLKDGHQEVRLSYGELDRRAKAIASKLQLIVNHGSRALLVYPYHASLEFITAFMGCLYAGVVAVPCHPPSNRLTTAEVQTRLVDAKAEIVLSDSGLLIQLQKLSELSNSALHWLDTKNISETLADSYHIPSINADSLAFLQYTSGSTGEPKGVMITHGCLLQNQEMLRLAFGHDANSVGMGWLPLFHDMGLIGNVIQPIYLGICCIMMSPISFVQKPIRWLQAISKYQVTTSGAPNFAYELLCDRVKESQLKQLDLSSWKVAFCGAEPVQQSTINKFSQKFAVCGFQKAAFYPCYGMAEATLMITGGDYRKLPTIKYVDKVALKQNQVVFANQKQEQATPLVSAGYTWLDGKIAIVNPQTLIECAPKEVGEIWFSGSSIGQGYWQQPEATNKTFQANLNNQKFLRTGDLGFIADGELYITGRLNDVLVFWGLNYYPQQIEHTVAQSHAALKANSGVAFSVKKKGKERLVIVQEIERSYRKSFVLEDLVEAIRWNIFQQHFIDVYRIVLLTPGSLPKTSSGKVQRSATKTQYLAQNLSVMAQWSLPDEQKSDMTSLMERYTNPLTYLKMISAVTKGKLRRFFYVIATILLISCTAQNNQEQLQVNRATPSPKTIILDENFQIAMGQTLYVPVYSHIYHQDEKKSFDLAATLSIRNTDLNHAIAITSVQYYDWNGKLVKNYLEQPIEIAALSSTEFFINTTDRSGGSGAKFIVEWVAQTTVNEPIVEAIMIGTGYQQGISFVSPGKVIKSQNNPEL